LLKVEPKTVLETTTKKTFEHSFYNILDEFFESGQLCKADIKSAYNILHNYENKLQADELTIKLNLHKNMNNTQLIMENTENIVVTFYEYWNNQDDKNKKSELTKFSVNFNDLIIDFIYDVSENYKENGNNKSLFHQLYIDGNLILKKDQYNLEKGFINLTYIDELFKKIGIKSSLLQFLKLFTTILDIQVYSDLLNDIEQNPDNYFYNKEWISDSDISESSDDDNDNDNINDNKIILSHN
jgi:hypothetical protein